MDLTFDLVFEVVVVLYGGEKRDSIFGAIATEVRIFSGFEVVVFVFGSILIDGTVVVGATAAAVICVVGTACKNPLELSITMYCTCGTDVVTELCMAADVV